MGERQVFQPLTREDKITVVIYRIGIVLSALLLSAVAYLVSAGAQGPGLAWDILGYWFYLSVALSVFFIHLYIGKFKVYLKNLYFIGLACLAALLLIGKGSLSGAVVQTPLSLLLLLPLAGCLGFVTAKEAFCFQLFEGYLLAIIMPLYLLLVSASVVTGRSVVWGLVLIAAMLVIFTLRKVFMPLAYDIGDKSAYQ